MSNFKALLDYVNEESDETVEVESVTTGDNDELVVILSNGESYAICDESKRHEIAKESIYETFGYFDANFLENETRIPAELFQESAEVLNGKHELIDDILAVSGNTIDEFVKEAALHDGYSHFMPFDDEIELDDGTFAYEL